MHSWGDSGVDWKGISDAAHYIGDGLRKWGRISVMDMKEKFGTVRVYCHFGWYQLHSITHPGHHYCRYPPWLWHLDCSWGSRSIPYISRLVEPYQKWLYRFYYKRALRKWPHLREEILSCADYPELLKGM